MTTSRAQHWLNISEGAVATRKHLRISTSARKVDYAFRRWRKRPTLKLLAVVIDRLGDLNAVVHSKEDRL